MKGFALAVILGFFALIILVAVGANNSTLAPSSASAATKPKTPAVKAAETKRFETCRAKLKKAQELEMLYDLKWNDPSIEPRVVAGPTFFQVPIDAKEGFAQTVNCFLTAGEKGTYLNFDVLDWRTGNKIGRFSYGKFSM